MDINLDRRWLYQRRIFPSDKSKLPVYQKNTGSFFVGILFFIMKKILSFRTQECTSKDCLFRFPLEESEAAITSCPKCGAPLKDVGVSYGRHIVQKESDDLPFLEVHVLLDNIRSLYNVGSVFRTAESVGVQKLHLCGMTSTPDNPRLAKTAIGAENLVAWQHHNNGLTAAQTLQKQGFSLWAIEGGKEAIPLFDIKIPQNNQRIALVIGNELAGIDPEIMEICERILYIPMQGHKESLNLTVAFGVAAYYLRYQGDP